MLNRRSAARKSTAGKHHRILLVPLDAAVVLVIVLAVSLVSPARAVTASFPDVQSDHPHYAAITDLASRGIIGGYASGEFGPEDEVTRQQFAKMIVLTSGYPVSESDVCYFVDVSQSDATTLYPDNYVAACVAHGITTGKTNAIFDPYASITRFQAVSMVARAADDLLPGLLATPPASWTGTSAWAGDPTHGANAMRAEYNGLLTGLDLSILDPSGAMSRGEVAQVLHNLLAHLAKPPDPLGLTLAVSVAAGSGTVSVKPDRTTFVQGELVTLTAVPADGWSFGGWSGDAEGLTNPLTLIMDSDKTLTVTFTGATHPFENLGGVITSAPAACSRTFGSLDLFARGQSGALVHRSFDGTAWSDWEDLGGAIKAGSDPAAVSWGPDRVDVFIRATDDALWHRWWSGGAWSDWENLGGTLSAGPAAAYRNTAGGQKLLDVFTVGSNNRLWRLTFDGSAWGTWTVDDRSGPTPRAGLSPAAVTWGGSRIDLFLCGSDGALWYTYLPPGGEWSKWKSLGGNLTSSPTASAWSSWAEGRLEVFARASDSGLWRRTLVSGVWSAWENMKVGVIASAPAAVSWGPDRIDLFVQGSGSVLWHKWWDGREWRP